MRDYAPRPRQRRCRSCGKDIQPGHTPWIAVSDTGVETTWHAYCTSRKDDH